jgi:5-methylcytosine-specific restriction endonuclease McrA
MSGQQSRNRQKILEDSDNICFYCGGKYDTRYLHIDHKIPKSRGGSNKKSNLVVACQKCNLLKGTLTIEEFLKKAEKECNRHQRLYDYWLDVIGRIV